MSTRNRKALRMHKATSAVVVEDQTEYDKNIIDQVIKTLYANSDKFTLSLENEIYKPLQISLHAKESSRLFEIMISSGLVSPVIGFGNAGKVELTRSGYQLMAQFGGYKEYLSSLQNSQGPQTVILPIQIESEDHASEQPKIEPAPSLIKKISKKK